MNVSVGTGKLYRLVLSFVTQKKYLTVVDDEKDA
jgi:hypothetical protein